MAEFRMGALCLNPKKFGKEVSQIRIWIRRLLHRTKSSATQLDLVQACRPWGCRRCHGTPYFGRSVNPVSTKGRGSRICPPNDTGTPGFSDLPTALLCNHVNNIACKTLREIHTIN